MGELTINRLIKTVEFLLCQNPLDHFFEGQVVVFERNKGDLVFEFVSIVLDVVSKPFIFAFSDFNNQKITFNIQIQFVDADEIHLVYHVENRYISDLEQFQDGCHLLIDLIAVSGLKLELLLVNFEEVFLVRVEGFPVKAESFDFAV